jgi:ABC-type nitrate/sulfonate/bicarbonate transport system substrate-binding protein
MISVKGVLLALAAISALFAVQAFVLQGMNPGLELGIRKDRAAGYAWAKDLKGMKIGVSAPGSSTHMLVNHLLASVGLRQDDVSIKVLLTHNPAVRRAPVVWINQTYTNVFVEKALQQYK